MKLSRPVLIPALALLLSGALAGPVVAATASPTARLHDLFDREWRYRLQEDPLFATSVGVHDFDDRLPSQSIADQKRRAAADRAFLEELEGIDRAKLSSEDRLNAEIFESQLRDGLASFEFGEYQIPLNADSGFQSDF